jgi:hypothetical protein
VHETVQTADWVARRSSRNFILMEAAQDLVNSVLVVDDEPQVV